MSFQCNVNTVLLPATVAQSAVVKTVSVAESSVAAGVASSSSAAVVASVADEAVVDATVADAALIDGSAEHGGSEVTEVLAHQANV